MKRIVLIGLVALMAASAAPAGGSPVCTGADSVISVSDSKDRKERKKVETVTFDTNLHCKNCVKKVQENIAFEKGVKDLEVSLEKQTITVKYDPAKTSADSLAAAVRKLGYNAETHKDTK